MLISHPISSVFKTLKMVCLELLIGLLLLLLFLFLNVRGFPQGVDLFLALNTIERGKESLQCTVEPL